ncbi:MAG: TatD family hydrolase [Planctomycetes bacterium]|nr:TatD family hydrolase [Planctomycetota bacterium]
MMRIFDPHIHCISRTTDDYEKMRGAGVRAVIEPAFWVGQPRLNLGAFEHYFQWLLGFERFRASQFGIRHFSAIGLNAKEANNEKLADEVMEVLPIYLNKEGVVAVGEIGFDDQTKLEEKYLSLQLELALKYDLPVIIHSPHRDKKEGIRRTIDIIRDVGVPDDNIVMDHNNEETLPLVKETDMWAGHTIYPMTKMDAHRMVALIEKYGTDKMIVNSSADWGVSDPLSTRKTLDLLREKGFDDDALDKIFWRNPVEAFAKSGQFDPETIGDDFKVDQSELYLGNSVLRGQTPKTT